MSCTLSLRSKVWYQTVYREIETWHEFKKAFRRQFIGGLNHEELEDELRRRTQAKGEKVENFLTCFKYIVGHFRRPRSEGKQIALAYRNLLPEYRKAMEKKEIHSLADISKYGRRWERKKEVHERYTPPPPKEKPGVAPFGLTAKVMKVAAAAEVESSEDTSASQRGSKRRERKCKKTKKVASGASKEEVAAVKLQPLPTESEQTGWSPAPHCPRECHTRRLRPPCGLPAWSTPRGQPNDGGNPRRNYPSRGGPTQGGENRFIGACYICEETGHRTVQCPKRECYACRQVGHIAPECPSRQRAGPNETPKCQVCGQKGATFQTCGPCAPRRAQWGNGTMGGQNSPLTPHPTSQEHQ